MKFPVLYEDDDLLVIDKPGGFHVHRPEDRRIKVPRERICIGFIRDQYGENLRPVHRLDVGTSGCLIWAKNKESASTMCAQFQQHLAVQKIYIALVRGWLKGQWETDEPLALDSTGDMVAAKTIGEGLDYFKLPFAVGSKHAEARYSLQKIQPLTGRYRQIRRHLRRKSHPIVGDSANGDLHHNRFFRNVLKCEGLFLRATKISFLHPRSGQSLCVRGGSAPEWENLMKVLEPYRCSVEEVGASDPVLSSESDISAMRSE